MNGGLISRKTYRFITVTQFLFKAEDSDILQVQQVEAGKEAETSFLRNQTDQDELDLLHRVFQLCFASCYVHPIVWI